MAMTDGNPEDGFVKLFLGRSKGGQAFSLFDDQGREVADVKDCQLIANGLDEIATVRVEIYVSDTWPRST